MRKAFTLIELLVVIAIIAILAAILFPVFAQAKLAAKKTAGLAQMKQIGTATYLYLSDYDDGFPTWDWFFAVYPAGIRNATWAAAGSPPNHMRTWDAMILPYVKSGQFGKEPALAPSYAGVWQSPGAEYAPEIGRSIGINQLLIWDISRDNLCNSGSTSAASGCYVYPNANAIDEVSNTIFVADGGTEGRLEPTYFKDGWFDKFFMNQRPRRSAPFRYGDEGANYVMTDTSAKHRKSQEVYPSPLKNIPTGSWFAWDTATNVANICAAGKFWSPNPAADALIQARAVANGGSCTF